MFKFAEKQTTRRLPKGAVFNGTISAMTKGGRTSNEFDGESQKRIAAGLAVD